MCAVKKLNLKLESIIFFQIDKFCKCFCQSGEVDSSNIDQILDTVLRKSVSGNIDQLNNTVARKSVAAPDIPQTSSSPPSIAHREIKEAIARKKNPVGQKKKKHSTKTLQK